MKRYLPKTKIPWTVKNRFYSNILLPDENGCMIWIGGKWEAYGSFQYKNNYFIGAHRYSYLLHYGVHPGKYFVLHKCDNPPCVAPDHLFLGTHKDNMQDMINKKRDNRIKLTVRQVKEIKEKIKKGEKNKIISKEYNISLTTISGIRNKKIWKHID